VRPHLVRRGLRLLLESSQAPGPDAGSSWMRFHHKRGEDGEAGPHDRVDLKPSESPNPSDIDLPPCGQPCTRAPRREHGSTEEAHRRLVPSGDRRADAGWARSPPGGRRRRRRGPGPPTAHSASSATVRPTKAQKGTVSRRRRTSKASGRAATEACASRIECDPEIDKYRYQEGPPL